MNIKSQHVLFIIKYALCTCLLFSSFTYSAHQTILHIVTEENPPYQFTNNKGEVVGCAIDMLKAMLSITHDTPEIKILPWPRAYTVAKEKPNTMIFSMARNAFRENDFYWTGIIDNQENIFWGLSSKYPKGSISAAQLFDASILLANKSTADHILTQRKQFKLYRVTNISQGINMLIHNRADLLVSPESVIKRRFKKMGENFNQITPVYQLPELSYNLNFAFNRQSSPEVIYKYTQAYQQLKKTNVIDTLKEKCH